MSARVMIPGWTWWCDECDEGSTVPVPRQFAIAQAEEHDEQVHS